MTSLVNLRLQSHQLSSKINSSKHATISIQTSNSSCLWFKDHKVANSKPLEEREAGKLCETPTGGEKKLLPSTVTVKSISYCFEETIRFEVKTSFPSRPVSRLIR